jgi:hypothetical protein
MSDEARGPAEPFRRFSAVLGGEEPPDRDRHHRLPGAGDVAEHVAQEAHR